MDSRTLLDYALFQLTPTRTRSDLVVFAGKKSEKIASGLLEPFLSHLKSAKDQISKGGYSITLEPASPDASSWFTKATLERFVRFVSTPEVLERFVTIEREINQIESSIESNEQVNGTVGTASATYGDPKIPVGPSKSKVESSSSGDAEAEEKPKVRLQRVLESRKAILKKEQAMAYARALVAGFEMDYIYDLVSFSDAFGAQRLREACINFMELCKKKNDDKIWMDEVAAMQASYLGTPGIILAGESIDLSQTGLAKSSTSDSITRHESLDASEGTDNGLPTDFNLQQTDVAAQLPTWPNYVPQYMQNAQGPMFQQMPPYQGYIFPGMHVAPSHYQGNVPWPANFQDSGVYIDRDIKDSQRHKSVNKKKGKHANHRTRNGESIQTDNSISRSDSSDEQEHEPSLSSEEQIHKKKLNKHSSRKVVIRNINYIASARNEEGSDSESHSSEEDEYVDADSLKQQVEAAVGSLRHHKPASRKHEVRNGSKKAINKPKNALDIENVESHNSENWDIFQNLLIRNSDSNSTDKGSTTVQIQEERFSRTAYGDESLSLDKNLDKPRYASDDFLFTQRSTGNGIDETSVKFQGGESIHGVIKRSSKDEELLIPPRVEGEYYLQNAHFGTESSIIRTQKEEDWIIGNTSEISANPGRHADHNIFNGDQASVKHFQIGESKREILLDDSFMVQSRLLDSPVETQHKSDIIMVSDIFGSNQSKDSVPGDLQGKVEVSNFYEPEELYMTRQNDSSAEQAVPSWSPEMDYGNSILLDETVRNQHNTDPRDSVDATLLGNGNANNTKTSKESGRKVGEREAKSKAPSGYLGRSKSDIPSRSKISTAGSTMMRSKTQKEEEKRKKMEELLMQRQKRIAERSAAKDVTPETSKRSLKESKNTVSTKTEKAKLHASTDENKKSHKPVMRSSTINRLAAARTTTKPLSTESKVGQNRKPPSKGKPVMANSSLKKTKGAHDQQDKAVLSDNKAGTNNSEDSSPNIQGRQSIGTTPSILEDSRKAEETLEKNGLEDFGIVKVLHTVTSVEKGKSNMLSVKDASDDKNSIQILSDKDFSSLEDQSEQIDLKSNINGRVEPTSQITVLPIAGNNLQSTVLNIKEKCDEKKKLSFSPEISVVGISTPPPYNETNPELIHSRKKWNNGETSPKAPKGFRKLLLFGRRT